MEGSKTSKGRAIQNLINIEQDDKVKAFINTRFKDTEYVNSHYAKWQQKRDKLRKHP